MFAPNNELRPLFASSETSSVYNLQGRLAQSVVDSDGDDPDPAVTYQYEYDDNGIRISQSVGTTKTIYVVNANNPTGYSQVLEEKNPTTGLVEKTYTIGQDVHTLAVLASAAVYHHLYDGHGSTRALLRAADSAIVQKYAYDAYGNLQLAGLTGYMAAVDQALTSLLYSGEQTDKTGQQYLRARYYDPASGRFNRLDPFAGDASSPQSLHRYLYAHANPVNGHDPSGLFLESLAEELEFQLQRAQAGLSALRSAFDLERLVSVYESAVGAYAQLTFRAAEFAVRAGPAIQTVTTWSGAVFVASTIQLACEQANFVPRTGYTEFVAAASGFLFTEGLSLLQISNYLENFVRPLSDTQDGRLLTGAMANRESLARHPGYTRPPFRPYTIAVEGNLANGTRLLRFWGSGTTREGSFTVLAEDAEGLSFAQVQNRFALPFLPTKVAYADGSGLRAVVGLAGRNFGMMGNGRQVDLIDYADFRDNPF